MINEFNDICTFRLSNPISQGSIKTNDDRLNSIKETLKTFKKELDSHYNNYKGQTLSIRVSIGQSYFPNVIHICILPKGQTVSNGIYVAICFDIYGRGALAGCAESISNPKGLNPMIRLSKNQNRKNLNIDVDGMRPTTKYNNTFKNPKEFIINKFSETDFYSHINASLDLALSQLGLFNTTDILVKKSINIETTEDYYNPTSLEDAKRKIYRQITERRGQGKFREELLRVYNNKCAVTGCNVIQVLEAAHIQPYNGEKTNHIQNGIILRADIHTLFDLGFITISAKSKKIIVHSSLVDTMYYKYNGMIINLHDNKLYQPNDYVLKYHNENCFKN